MRLRPIILSLALCAGCALYGGHGHAKVTQVGPTSFHKQMQIPNSIGKSGNLNNDDGYSSGNQRHLKRQNRRQDRLRERQAANEEVRTQSDKTVTQKRKGRRDSNRLTPQQRRLQQKGMQEFMDNAQSGLND